MPCLSVKNRSRLSCYSSRLLNNVVAAIEEIFKALHNQLLTKHDAALAKTALDIC